MGTRYCGGKILRGQDTVRTRYCGDKILWGHDTVRTRYCGDKILWGQNTVRTRSVETRYTCTTAPLTAQNLNRNIYIFYVNP